MKKAITFILLLGFAGAVYATTFSRVSSTAFKSNQKRVINNIVGEIETAVNDIQPTAVAITGSNSTTVADSGAIVKQATLDVSTSVVIDGSSGAGWGTVQVGVFPEGQIEVIGFVVTNVTMIGDGGDLAASGAGGDFSFGTTGTADNTLDSTDVNLCPKTSCDPLQTAVSAMLAGRAVFDGTTTPVPIYFSWMVDDADVSASSTNAVTADILVTYINLGDK